MEIPDPKDLYGDSAHKEENPRCWRCNKLLAELLTIPYRIVCTRCKARNQRGS
jgi:hypothetical protein